MRNQLLSALSECCLLYTSGWLTLHAGIAGGADIILIPEIPYDIEKVVEAINRRNKAGKGFTILAVAEGAVSKEDAKLPKKELKKKLEEYKKQYPSVAYKLASELEKKLDLDIRITIPGHMQRGGCLLYTSRRRGRAGRRRVADHEKSCTQSGMDDEVFPGRKREGN